ncbi:prolyl oligopeptidase family serine peptidase [Schleiferia thermophila]|jgi:prolyl oligopeptidase|uniref:prolyl oligopeptidase family serine peptidase n=1 Tax=Schleiferia thermophila TaxID=884107 RepID=UPI0004E61329|nr:prolyl oligopeptidase family serine peptidase [Schleiferia thermophila]KFD38894.1 prolyl endopeptidase [Schleiferia thermophila str. Yellowstone]PMB20777.1 S9 family peptidase [Fischerella thermalis CCMEE 5319]
MHRNYYGLALCSLFLLGCENENNLKVQYPITETVDISDTYFGIQVSDPYRWLEDDMSEKTADWVQQQNEVTAEFLNRIPFRGKIFNRLEELWNYEKVSPPFTEGEFTYFYKNDGLQNQSVLYRTDKSGNTEVFIDPNNFSADGTTSLAGISFTKDGSLAVYQISEAGSDWRKVILINALTKEILEDTLFNIKFSGLSWNKSEGFFYSSYDLPEDGSILSAKTDQHKLYYHKIGTKQSEDQLIFGNSIKRRYVGGYVTEDNSLLIISAANTTTGNELYYKDLRNPKSEIVTLIGNFDNSHSVVHFQDEHLYILTNLNAPNRRLVKAPLSSPAPENWTDVIPERDMPLSVSTGAGYLFASYLKDATSLIEQYDLNGNKIRDIKLPAIGTASGFSGKWNDTILYYTFTNYVIPPTIYSFDPTSGESNLYRKPDVKFNPDDYESKQIFYTSKDGTRIPMIISYKKGLKLNGKNPTILYGYGGFNISLTPSFSVSNLVWMEMGGVYAVPNLRGGGEYGKKWHDAGRQFNKQNVFNDFIAAAEWLIANKYTSPDFLAIAGGSNGGLLVGATMTQRPELFKVALPAVGVLDMLRYHKFTAGAGWAYDYGTADDSKEMFEYLLGYSPYHNLRKGMNYPATLITTADHDDRVVPAHSFKFAARLQAVNDGPNPTLIRIETNAGHGAGKPTRMILQETTDRLAFTLFCMGKKDI